MTGVRSFGLGTEAVYDIVSAAASQPPEVGVTLVVAPNINHIATLRQSPALSRTDRKPARTVWDSEPAQLYARRCGCRPERATGCRTIEKLMRLPPYSVAQRLLLLVCKVTVSPLGFETDEEYCQLLAASVSAAETTVLVMAGGAPHSEAFVDTNRTVLSRRWAFYVGQAVKKERELVAPASAMWRSIGLEWLWRVWQEPSRLTKHYATASVGFCLGVIDNQFQYLRERHS